MRRKESVSTTTPRYCLSRLDFEDAIRDLTQVGADHVRALDQGVEHHPRPRYEGRRAAGAQGARHVPGVGGDQANTLDFDLEALGGHAVRLGGGLEAPDHVCGEDLLEVAA